MAKKSKGGIPHPSLDKPKNMPGAPPMQAITKMFGGKGKISGAPKGKMHEEGGGIHDMGGHTPKTKEQKKGKR